MKLAYVPPIMFIAICCGVALLKCFLFIMNYFRPFLGAVPVIIPPPVNLKDDIGDGGKFLGEWTLDLEFEDLREEPNELMLLFESCLGGTIAG